MALLDKGEVEETYFPDCDDYILLWKLEVLENIKVVAMLKSLSILLKKIINLSKPLLETTQKTIS